MRRRLNLKLLAVSLSIVSLSACNFELTRPIESVPENPTNITQDVPSTSEQPSVDPTSATPTISPTTIPDPTSTTPVVPIDVHASELVLNPTSMTLDIGGTRQISYSIYPTNSVETEVDWSSNNSSIASVLNGMVTAHSSGDAVITGKVHNRTSVYATVSVHVNEPEPIHPSSVSLNLTSLNLVRGSSGSQLTATVLPEDADDKSVTWSVISGTSVNVSSSGFVSPISSGDSVVQVKTNDGNKTDTCNVSVSEPDPEVIEVSSIVLDTTSDTLNVGQSLVLTATVYPSNATNKTVSWSSSNTSVATVSNGTVTAKAAGNAVITASSNNGKQATCNITVNVPTVAVTGVSLNKTSLTLVEGNSEALIATVAPSNATNQSVTWESSNTSVATVDSNGKVSASTAGSSLITVKTVDGNKTASCNLTVQSATVAVTGVSLDQTSSTLTVGNTLALTATVTPSNATNKNITWSSSNTNVATVSNGTVTAVAAGSATITAASTAYPSIKATCTITVENAVIDNHGKVSTDPLTADEAITICGGSTTPTADYYYVQGTISSTPSYNSTHKSYNFNLTTSSGTFYAYSMVNNPSYSSFTGTELSQGMTAILYGKIFFYTSGSKTEMGYNSNSTSDTYYVYSYTGGSSTVSVTGVSVSPTSKSIAVGETFTVSATVTPSNATDKTVTWSSSNESVATISGTTVTAKAVGSANITATTNDGNFTSSCSVTVTSSGGSGGGSSSSDYIWTRMTDSSQLSVGTKVVIATETSSYAMSTNQKTNNRGYDTVTKTGSTLTFDSSSTVCIFELKQGSSSGLYALYDTTNKNYLCTYDSSHNYLRSTDSISVDSSWEISTSSIVASSSSNRNIMYFNKNDSSNMFFGCYATVPSSGEAPAIYIGEPSEPVYATDINISGSSEIGINETLDLTVTFVGSGVNQKTLTFESLNTGIATVNSSGTVTGVAAGSTQIKVGYLSAENSYSYKNFDITVKTISLSSISFSPTSQDVTAGVAQTVTLSPIFSPSNATNKNVTYSVSGTGASYLTVSSAGVVTTKTTSVAGTSAVIKCTSAQSSSIYANFTINFVAQEIDDWTVLVYMCGSDLESGYDSQSKTYETDTDYYGNASKDIKEMLNASGQGSKNNVVIETGGAKRWMNKSDSGLNLQIEPTRSGSSNSTAKLGRYHIENQALVQDASLTNASMGNQSTLENFISWGMENYPAQKTALILWNHGGALRGCCYDETQSGTANLTPTEVDAAITGAIGSSGKSFEFIGYDCCLMSVQEIASQHSAYAKYMIASEESEAGDGWNYTNWLKGLYQGKATSTFLTTCCDEFVKQGDGSTYYPNDQTLSVLDLTKMSTYKSEFETLATQMKNLGVDKATWASFFKNNVTFYGSDRMGDTLYNYFMSHTSEASSYGYTMSDYTTSSVNGWHYDENNYGWDYYGVFDIGHFLTALKSKYSSLSTQISKVQTAYNNLIVYNKAGSYAGTSTGLTLFYPATSYCSRSTVYPNSNTYGFANWQSFITNYGY